MQAIQGGLSRSKNKRNSVRLALAVSALMVALPSTAVAQTHPAHRQGATARAEAGRSHAIRLDRPVLSLGSGYGRPGGSPLVRATQRRLLQEGYPPHGIDGIFGPRTRRAVIAFQAAHRLKQDGVVGPRTWAALAVPTLSLGPGAGDAPGGSAGVRSLQRHLAAAGSRPGPVDGHYGPRTEAAVKRFQRSHGLRVDGVAGPRMLALLSEPAHPAHRSTRRPAHRSNPARAPRKRPATTARKAPARPTHTTGVPWIVLFGLALLLACVLAFIVGAVWYVPRRGDGQFSPASAAGGDAGAAESDRPEPTSANAAVAAAATPGAVVFTNGHGNGNGWMGDVNGGQVNGNGVAGNGDGVQVNGNGVAANGDGVHGNHGSPDPRHTAEADSALDLGLLLAAQGSAVEAQAAYSRADELGHAAAAANLGRLLEEQGALTEAEAAYRRADERGDAAGAFNLGVMLEERGVMDAAADAYRRATARGHDGAASNLGVLLEEQGALVEAEAAYRRADERGDATGAFNLGVLLEEQGSVIAAREAYHRAEQRGDGDVANMARAALLELREREEGAGAQND
jgi:peptidoglycan hydrolase-like protein with peptidoglycan-binding domain